MLHFLYETAAGRVILKGLTMPWISEISGKFMDSWFSKPLIPWFIKKNNIDMTLFEKEDYKNFNQCFIRKIKPKYRPMDMRDEVFMSPCDGLLSAYPIKDDLVIPVKNSRYSITDLLRDKELASEFEGGTCLVFRLCVNHYHRYCYPDGGSKGENIFIPGILHTVRPIALRNAPVFTENSREYTVLDTDNFGRMVQMEVGAMLVGKINNYHEEYSFLRGEEKGHFVYGGSTVIILLKKDTVRFSKRLFDATANNKEWSVRMGQMLGKKIR